MEELILDGNLKRALVSYIRSDESKTLAEFVKLCESGLLTEDLILQLGGAIPYYNNWDELFKSIKWNRHTLTESVKMANSYYMKVVLGWDRAVTGKIEFKQFYELIGGIFARGWIMDYFRYNYTGVHYQLLNSFKGDVDDEEFAICLLRLYSFANINKLNGFINILELDKVIYEDLIDLGIVNKQVSTDLKGNCKMLCDVIKYEYKESIISLSSETYYKDLLKRWQDLFNNMLLVDD